MVGIPLATFAASAGADAGGNVTSARMCNQGGYQTLTRLDATTFANVGECLAYAVHGGTLFDSDAAQRVCASLGGTYGDTNAIPDAVFSVVLFTCNRFIVTSDADFVDVQTELGSVCPTGAVFFDVGGTYPTVFFDYTCGDEVSP
jgi:hypothetical protein